VSPFPSLAHEGCLLLQSKDILSLEAVFFTFHYFRLLYHLNRVHSRLSCSRRLSLDAQALFRRDTSKERGLKQKGLLLFLINTHTEAWLPKMPSLPRALSRMARRPVAELLLGDQRSPGHPRA
jgi:hypothetical protein